MNNVILYWFYWIDEDGDSHERYFTSLKEAKSERLKVKNLESKTGFNHATSHKIFKSQCQMRNADDLAYVLNHGMRLIEKIVID